MKKIFIIFISIISLYSNIFASSVDVLVNPELGNAVDGSFEISGNCVPTCRPTKAGYVAKVVDFSPYSGITKCIVVQKDINESNEFYITADTKNLQCVKNMESVTVLPSELSSANAGQQSQYTLQYNDTMTLSRIFGGIATLDKDVIDIPTTIGTGRLNLGAGQTNILTGATGSTLGFFIKLFHGFQKVYQYVQYFLFIFVGAFFLTILIWNLAIQKVGKTGEKQEKLNKFVVPLVMILFCFIPIPNPTGIATTPIQNTMQYFIQESNKLADRLSVIGNDAYMQKVFVSTGAGNEDIEENTLLDNKKNILGFVAYKSGYNECMKYFDDSHFRDNKTFQLTDEERILEIEKQTQSISGQTNYTFKGCRKIEADIINNERRRLEGEITIRTMKNSIDNGLLNSQLYKLHADMQNKSDSYGWWYSTYITSTSVIANSILEMNGVDITNQVKERNIDIDKKYNLDTGTNEYLSPAEDGSFLGALAYFMLPGAGSIYKASMESDKQNPIAREKSTKAVQGIAKYGGYIAKGLKNIPFVGAVAGAVDGALHTIKAFLTVMFIRSFYNMILEFLPLVVGMVAGMIVIGAYIIELIKYFYVAPFMAIWSITNKRQTKIIEFFIDGIALFLKPMLIVISIFLGVFVYHLFIELFIGLMQLQFTFYDSFPKDTISQTNVFVLSTLMSIFYIICSIATSFLVYKIITEGSKAFLSIAGLQDKENLTSSISQRMDRHTFQV